MQNYFFITGGALPSAFIGTYTFVDCPEHFYTGDGRQKVRLFPDFTEFNYGIQPINFRRKVIGIRRVTDDKYNGQELEIEKFPDFSMPEFTWQMPETWIANNNYVWKGSFRLKTG